MATLNKLAIRGIRSFDDKQISVIEFFSPVTVIVGHNGSGKTTIIECLKYATTGDQPPNTRGGAFVHDPKMANEKEVKAQVKLRFNAGNGKRMLAVRNLSVTVKKGGALTMKTLESILANANDNEKSGKVCHIACCRLRLLSAFACRGASFRPNARRWIQRSRIYSVSPKPCSKTSYSAIKKIRIGRWLSPALSRRSSMTSSRQPSEGVGLSPPVPSLTVRRYTKALDAIKSLRKDRVAELKTEQERLESLSREKAHSDKLVKRVSDLNSTITAKELEYEEVKRDYDQLVQANKKFYEQSTKFREMYLKLESLQEKKARYEEDLANAKENLQVVSGLAHRVNVSLPRLTARRCRYRRGGRATAE